MTSFSQDLALELLRGLRALGFESKFLYHTDDGACWIQSEAEPLYVGMCMERLRHDSTTEWYHADIFSILQRSALPMLKDNQYRYEINAERLK